MQPLEPPEHALWRSRSAWFWRAHDVNAGPQPPEFAPPMQSLLAELEAVYCVGAWSAAVILAWTIVEGELRAGRAAEDAPDIDWLRERRNALAHIGPRQEDAVADDRLENLAQGAIRIVFKTLFAAAWR